MEKNALVACGDFKRLTKQISFDQHALPKMEELIEKLQDGTVFAKIDLLADSTYLQLKLAEEAKRLCVINAPIDYSVTLCFGGALSLSPAQFQQCMDTMITGLPWVTAYLDNLIVSRHWSHIRRALAQF